MFFKAGYLQKQKQTLLLMAQSGGNSIILYTYLSEPGIFLETGTRENMFEFAEKTQKPSKQEKCQDINT